MATYIDRETYRNRLANLENWCQDLRKPGLKQALEMFDEVPAADVAEVVRCKDCYQSAVIGDVLYCTYWGKNTDENGYCHEGG